MKSTERYPEGFGHARNEVYRLFEHDIVEAARQRHEAALTSRDSIRILFDKLTQPRDPHSEWDHAKLDSVFAFLFST